METLPEDLPLSGTRQEFSMPEGAGSPEVAQELVAKVHHEIPDVLSHL